MSLIVEPSGTDSDVRIDKKNMYAIREHADQMHLTHSLGWDNISIELVNLDWEVIGEMNVRGIGWTGNGMILAGDARFNDKAGPDLSCTTFLPMVFRVHPGDFIEKGAGSDTSYGLVLLTGSFEHSLVGQA